MKRILLFIILIGFNYSAFAQAPVKNDLFEFNKSRNKKTIRGLKVLGGWAVANMAVSGALYFNTKGTDQYFHQMNVMWNGVNTLIVAASLLPKQKNDLDLNKTLKGQSNTESLYIANAALDLVYSSTGLYLTERAKTDSKNHDKFKGWGNSLIMQGGFLFLFDTAMFVIHKKNGKKLYKMMDNITINTAGIGLKIRVQL